MPKNLDIREDLIYDIKQVVGAEPCIIICSNELRYELNVRTSDGSYVVLFLNKDSIGSGGRITFEVSCFHRAVRENALVFCKRFHDYEEVARFLIKYRPILCDLVHSFVDYRESSSILSKV